MIPNSIKSYTSKVVDSAKLKSYVLRKKTGVDVLEKLKLGDDVATALTSKKLKELSQYITMYNTMYRNKISLIETLATRYALRDDALAKALVTMERNAETAETIELAMRLRSEQLDAWLKGGKSVGDVFKLLKLGDDGYAAFFSRKLEVLEDYIAFFNKEKAGDETLLKVLTAGLGGEKDVLRIIAAGAMDPRAAEKVQKLREDLLVKWRSENVKPNVVIEELNLPLNDVYLPKLLKYMIDFNVENPADQVAYVRTLTSHYGDDVMAEALDSAQYAADTTTRTVAKELQTEQLKGWLDSEESFEFILKALKINTDGRLTARNWKIKVLDKYMTLFHTKNPLDKTDTIDALSKGFGGEDKFALAVAEAMERLPPSSTSIVSQFQNKLFQRWSDSDLDPMSVLVQVLKVDENKLTAITAREKSLIDEYKEFYYSKTEIFNPVLGVGPRRS